jgi:hypothetical protein
VAWPIDFFSGVRRLLTRQKLGIAFANSGEFLHQVLASTSRQKKQYTLHR